MVLDNDLALFFFFCIVLDYEFQCEHFNLHPNLNLSSF